MSEGGRSQRPPGSVPVTPAPLPVPSVGQQMLFVAYLLFSSALKQPSTTSQSSQPDFPPCPKGTEPISGCLYLLLAGANGFGGTRDRGKGKGFGLPLPGVRIIQKAALFLLNLPLAGSNRSSVGCFVSSFFGWFFFPSFLLGAIIYQLRCQIIPDFIYVPSA